LIEAGSEADTVCDGWVAVETTAEVRLAWVATAAVPNAFAF